MPSRRRKRHDDLLPFVVAGTAAAGVISISVFAGVMAIKRTLNKVTEPVGELVETAKGPVEMIDKAFKAPAKKRR